MMQSRLTVARKRNVSAWGTGINVTTIATGLQTILGWVVTLKRFNLLIMLIYVQWVYFFGKVLP